MEQYAGKSVFGGIAIGKIKVYHKTERQVKRERISSPDREWERYQAAREASIRQLKDLYEKALREVGEANAAIFEIHRMMLEDEDYNESVENIIRTQEVNAEYAVAVTCDNLVQVFQNMDDDYMKERAADVKDISERVLKLLGDDCAEGSGFSEPVILAAEDLAPSETVQLDKDKILAFVTVKGSLNSHTAILARTMGIPALVGSGLEKLKDIDGKTGIVDGTEGIFYVEPEEAVLERFRGKQREDQEKKELLFALKGRENITLDGKRIMLYANIGSLKDIGAALQNDAGGIGLFRSEFLYLEKDTFPTEEEQFAVYKQAAETMAGKTVIIRTLDIGADKQCDYFGLEKEENPAMGYRAIRICLTEPEIFKAQLRALLRASAFGHIDIMYPMITSVWEVKRIKELFQEARRELEEKGVVCGTPKQGIMIETPAAVMMSGELAEEVDFFSIGTNDLTQYTLAADRQNPRLDRFYDARHPAVLRMIRMAVENAHKAGIWAGICGELGGDLELTREFLAMGVDELSVSPGAILPLRKVILETDTRQPNINTP